MAVYGNLHLTPFTPFTPFHVRMLKYRKGEKVDEPEEGCRKDLKRWKRVQTPPQVNELDVTPTILLGVTAFNRYQYGMDSRTSVSRSDWERLLRTDSTYRASRAMAAAFYGVSTLIVTDVRHSPRQARRCALLVGLAPHEFREHIQRQFTGWMSWGNYGSVWNFDHIIPQSFFDPCQKTDWPRCHHFTNIRPRLKQENCPRGSRVRFGFSAAAA